VERTVADELGVDDVADDLVISVVVQIARRGAGALPGSEDHDAMRPRRRLGLCHVDECFIMSRAARNPPRRSLGNRSAPVAVPAPAASAGVLPERYNPRR